MNPLVSFIIPSYNHARYLREGIASIVNQTMSVEYEIIVVDDCSTDETLQLLESLDEPRLSFVRHPQNRGTTASVSHALTLTRGTYVAQLDADDRFRLNFLAETLPIFFAHPDLAMVYGDVASIDEAGAPLADLWQEQHARQLHGGRESQGDELVWMVRYSPSSATARLMRGDLARAQAPFPDYLDGRFPSAEWFLNLRLARHHEVYYLPCVLADYRLHPLNQHSRSPVDLYREQSIINVLDHLFAEGVPQLQAGGLKAEIYGDAYLQLGDAYFGAAAFPEARRCYLRALRLQPRRLVRAGGLHRLLGTGMGARRYSQTKQHLRAWLNVTNDS